MKKKKRLLAVVLVIAIFFTLFPFRENDKTVLAKDKVLTLSQAQNLAVAKSAGYKKVLNKIDLQEIKYAAAVKSIQMKKKNMSTFRWTPLLNFKFPEKATLADEYEWQYKPLQITCVINELKHQLSDEKLASKEKISNLYVEAYVCQTKIEFAENRLAIAEKTLEKNKIRLLTGEANQTDVNKMEQKVDKLKTEISLQKRTFLNKKKKMSKLLGIDITTGYTLNSPYVEASIPREVLQDLVNYTLDHDQSYFETKLETKLCLTGLNLTESLMQGQYGSKMNGIKPYIRQARNGEEVDSEAFKRAYRQMLSDVDQPWVGKKKILFVKINKEWFKGAISGSRYVEDDPYQLYEEALEYAESVRNEQDQKEEITASVEDTFEALVTAKNSYDAAKKLSDSLQGDEKKAVEQNKLGDLPYEELTQIQNEYEEQQLATLDLLAEYTKQLYSYDRLTCGGISEYLSGTDFKGTVADGGNSYLAKELEGKVYYYIEDKIEDNIFEFGISVPENYSLDITHFELYVNGTKIGEKTEVGQNLRHLALDLDMVETSEVYLYHDNELLAICEFDSSENQNVLKVSGGYVETKKEEKVVATYSYTVNETLGMVELGFTKKDTESISFYELLDSNGIVITGENPLEITKKFTHLSILTGNFTELSVRFYDNSQNLLYTGYFDEITSSIKVKET